LYTLNNLYARWLTLYRYTGTNLVADVSYDLWLAPSASANNQYEIMIWVGAYGGAGPISSTGSAIATVSIAGSSWKLFKGPNGDTTVFSFVATKNVGNFNGDLNEFFKYLTSKQGVSKNMVITSLQAGTEPFEGKNGLLFEMWYKANYSRF
jgi:xyloglucan-specific endo-beta-1,4-glucanase